MTAAPIRASDVATRLGRSLRGLGRRLRQDAPTHLTPSQASVLATLADRGALRIGELASAEAMAPAVATRVVAFLEEQRHVERRPAGDDRRAWMVRLTASGAAALATARAEQTRALTQRLERLTGAQLRALEAALPALEALNAD